MKLLAKIFFVVCGLLCARDGFAQNLSNRGTEFWVGYGHHQFMETGSNSQEMVLYLSAEEPAVVTVTIDSTAWTKTYNIPANTVLVSDLIPKAGTYDARLFSLPVSFGGNGGEGLFRFKGIHIQSDVPIVAYAHIYGSASSGATMLMPVETWGYVYTSVNSMQDYASNCFSWVYAIAQHDSTLIEVTPAVTTRLGNPAGVPFTVLLMKGQIYQTMGGPENANPKPEMTGTKIRSIGNASGKCYPIAVFSGSSRTFNTPVACGSAGGGDNDNQQCFPSQAWGKRYLTAPASNSNSPNVFQTSTYKIAVKDPTTVVKRNGVQLTGLINNYYYKFESNTPEYIEADKPVMVAQFLQSGPSCQGGPGLGDPEMMYLSPIEQGIKRIGFYRNSQQAITVNYLTLIIPTAGVSSLLIDGSASFSYTYPHPQLPGYTVVIKRWTIASGQGYQCIVTSDSAFTAITYGLGNVESYGYNAGTLINNLNALSGIHNVYDSSSISKFTCTNTPFEMSVLMRYQPTNMYWELSNLAPKLSPAVDVNVPSPMPVDSPYINGVKYYRYTLPGNYSFNDTGTFHIPILSTHPSIENCNNTEEVKFDMIVKGKPNPDFNIIHSGCTADSAHFNGIDTTSNNYTVGKWKWEFPGPAYDSGKIVAHLFAPGTYNVKLTVISTEGCVGDTTKPIVVLPRPTAGFTLDASTICQGTSSTLIDTATNTGLAPITNWWWDFGNGNTANANNPTEVYNYPNFGTFTIKHVLSSSNSCVSDTVSKVITVFAKPVTSFTFPNGCLPTSGLVQFTNTTTIGDGQTLNYTWIFNDPNANGGNPNTSTQTNPTHIFLTGTYNVQLTATTANGCSKDTIVPATFNLKPSLAYPPLTAVCQNAAPISVATATVTNGVPGTGVYSGPGTSSNGTFNPSLAGFGTHTIWYVFTSTANCKDSISQTILVNAAPQTNFTYPAGCLGTSGFAQFTNTTTIGDAQTMSYAWNFNDPNANAGNPNTSIQQDPSHNFSPGTYNVNLTTTSSSGCVSTLTKNITFNLQPQLAYPSLSSVCQNISSVSIASAMVLNGVTGNGIYSGPGTNAAGVFTPGIAGPGVHTIKYVFTSPAGCSDSITQTIKVLPKPTGSFIVTANVCQNQAATITDQSTIASGSIVNWWWDFGDATTANYNNGNPFTQTYSNFNTYTVKLVARSDSSCLSDTATKTIAVHAIPTANFNLPTGVCMPGGTANFTNGTSVGDGVTLNYQWDFGDGSAINNNTNPSHIFPAINTYNVQLTATSTFGCANSITKPFNDFYDKPVAAFVVSPDTLCQGANNNFNDQSFAPNSSINSWNWSFGDGSTSNTQNPTKLYVNAGNYNVNLTVTNTQGCVSTPITKTVVVYVQPVIDAGPSFVVPQGTIIQFNPRANDSTTVSFVWSPATGLSSATTLRPMLTAIQDQTYTLTAIGQGSCTATDFMAVKILKPLVIPNAFSPNGDGINDTWVIQNLSDYPNATVDIFNRWGQQIFHSNGYATPWDGTYKGSLLPLATYYYVIELKNGFKPLTGSITIVR